MEKKLHTAKKEIDKFILSVSAPEKPPARLMGAMMHSVRNEKSCIILTTMFTLFTFLVLDFILFFRIQTSNLFDQKPNADGLYSPFSPLTIKLIMTDHVTHYVFSTLSEYFNKATSFSEVFTFITPNVISCTHLIIALISLKFFSSESLRVRRFGVLLFEIRNFLDSLDGVIYRARSGNVLYQSNRSQIGYYVDILSDIIGSFALYFGILFYYYKCPPTKCFESLPFWRKAPTEVEPGVARPNSPLTKKFMFWKVFCVGMLVLVAAGSWDKIVMALVEILQKPSKDPKIQILQMEAFHKTSTFFVMWIWRLIEGQALIQMMLYAIFIDKAWEFITFIGYLGFVVVIMVNAVSYIHLQYLNAFLKS